MNSAGLGDVSVQSPLKRAPDSEARSLSRFSVSLTDVCPNLRSRRASTNNSLLHLLLREGSNGDSTHSWVSNYSTSCSGHTQ
jgi:hypothetical protein